MKSLHKFLRRPLIALFVVAAGPPAALAATPELEIEYSARIAGFMLRSKALVAAVTEASRFANDAYNAQFPTGVPIYKVSGCHPDKIAPGAPEPSARVIMHACFANADAQDDKSLAALRNIVGTSISATLNKLAFNLLGQYDRFVAGVKALGYSAARAISEIGQCVAEAAGLVNPTIFVANAAAKTAYATTAGKMSVYRALKVGFDLPSPAKVSTECKQAVTAARAHVLLVVESAKKAAVAVVETAHEVVKTATAVTKQVAAMGKELSAQVVTAAKACLSDTKKCSENVSLFIWEAIKKRVVVGQKVTIDFTLSVEIPMEGLIIAPGTQVIGTVERTSDETFEITLTPALRVDVGVGTDVHKLGATGGLSIAPLAKFRLTKAKHLRELAYLLFKGISTGALTGLLSAFGSALNPVLGAIVGMIGAGVSLKTLLKSDVFYEFGGIVCQELSLRETELLNKVAFADLYLDVSNCFSLTARRDGTLSLWMGADLDALVASNAWTMLKSLFSAPMKVLGVAAVKDIRARFATGATISLKCEKSAKASPSKFAMASIANAFKLCSPSGSIVFDATLGVGIHSYLLSLSYSVSVSTPKLPKKATSLKELVIALATSLPVQTLKLAVSENSKRFFAFGFGGKTAAGVNVTPDIVSGELMFNYEKPVFACSVEVASGEFVKAMLGKKPKFPASCEWAETPSAKTATTTKGKPTAVAAAALSSPRLGYSTGDGVRIRSQPTTSASIVGQLEKCASFEIVASNVAAVGAEPIKTWTKVKVGATSGYVASSYVGASACAK